MKRHVQNAACGVLDYAAYPLGMLAAVPILLRGLGPSQFGIWAFTVAVINTGAILASGFADANIQQIAVARSTGDSQRVASCVRTTLSIHLLLGTLLPSLRTSPRRSWLNPLPQPAMSSAPAGCLFKSAAFVFCSGRWKP